MAIKCDISDTFIGVSCSTLIQRPFADGMICLYTAMQPGKTSVNEDAAAIITCDEDVGVLMVADGLGGLPEGNKASAAAVQEICKAVTRGYAARLSMRESILDGIEQANKNILDMNSGAATTIIAIEINGKQIRSYHVGDSMALVTGQRGKIKYQTIPHSPVGYAVEAGLMQEEEAMQHDERHIISNMVGSREMRLDIGPLMKLDRRDTLVIGSDGLFDNLTIEEIVSIIRCGPLQDCAEKMISISHGRMVEQLEGELHKPDDLSFILYRPG